MNQTEMSISVKLSLSFLLSNCSKCVCNIAFFSLFLIFLNNQDTMSWYVSVLVFEYFLVVLFSFLCLEVLCNLTVLAQEGRSEYECNWLSN